MAELVALERILKEIDRIDLYLELLEKGDLDMLRHLLERERESSYSRRTQKSLKQQNRKF